MLPAIPTSEPTFLQLLREGAEIDVCIPEDTPSPVLFEWIKGMGEVTQRAETNSRIIGYLLGRMMNMAASRPNFLAENGLKSYAEYEAVLKQFYDKGRSTIWDWKPIYKDLPNLTRQQLLDIPVGSLKLIKKIPDAGHRELALAAAAERTYPEFQSYVEAEGFVGPGEAYGSTLRVPGNKAQIAEIRAFLDHPGVQEWVGTSNYAEIIIALIGESQSSDGWPKICPKF